MMFKIVCTSESALTSLTYIVIWCGCCLMDLQMSQIVSPQCECSPANACKRPGWHWGRWCWSIIIIVVAIILHLSLGFSYFLIFFFFLFCFSFSIFHLFFAIYRCKYIYGTFSLRRNYLDICRSITKLSEL